MKYFYSSKDDELNHPENLLTKPLEVLIQNESGEFVTCDDKEILKYPIRVEFVGENNYDRNCMEGLANIQYYAQKTGANNYIINSNGDANKVFKETRVIKLKPLDIDSDIASVTTVNADGQCHQ